MNIKNNVTKIISTLLSLYPEAKTALRFENPWELLVATILSAQCTDVRVNMVTPGLFKKYKSIKDFADADITELEQNIRSTGFYKNKTKNIIGAAKTIISKFSGQVPKTMEELTELPGVGRKTANVVLGSAFGISVGIVVDTHVVRLSQRIGFSKNTDPEKIEQDLMQIVPKDKWIIFSHILILHGRAVCPARNPQCSRCKILKLCTFESNPNPTSGV